MTYYKYRGDDYAPIPFEIQVALGQFPRYSTENKFGYNGAAGTSEEEIWNEGGFEAYLSSAERMNIVSTSTADDGSPGGTGARTLIIYGLDNDWKEINETITLNGTTDVLTVNSYIRVFRMIVLTAGSGAANAGVITAAAQTAGTDHANIAIGDNQTKKIQFSFPLGKVCIIRSLTIGVAKNENVEAKLKIRPFGSVFQVKRILNLFENAGQFINTTPSLIPEKYDITITSQTTTGNAAVSASLSYMLIDEREAGL